MALPTSNAHVVSAKASYGLSLHRADGSRVGFELDPDQNRAAVIWVTPRSLPPSPPVSCRWNRRMGNSRRGSQRR
jgi:hypothetical protein